MIPLPAKPRYGKPCNGCGLCCAREICSIGVIAHPGASAPCPSLKMSEDGTRMLCALIEAEQAYNLQPMIQDALGVGAGCTMHDESENFTLKNTHDMLNVWR